MPGDSNWALSDTGRGEDVKKAFLNLSVFIYIIQHCSTYNYVWKYVSLIFKFVIVDQQVS